MSISSDDIIMADPNEDELRTFKFESGTSLAAPMVAGRVATLLGLQRGKRISPSEMKELLLQSSLSGVVKNLPTKVRTPNQFLHIA